MIGGAQVSGLTIYGTTGSFDAFGVVTLSISDTNEGTLDVQASAIVDFNGYWSVPVNIAGLVDGPILVNARLEDPSDNVASTSVRFVKDANTFVFITFPDANAVINSVTASGLVVAGTGEAGGSVFVTVMDGDSSTVNVVSSTVPVDGNGRWTVTTSIAGLRDGVIRVMATIRDAAGNTLDSSTVTISKDASLTISVLNPTSYQYVISQARASSVTISGFADTGSAVSVVVSDMNGETANVRTIPVTVSPLGTWSLTANVLSLADGDLSFDVTARDTASNVVQLQSIILKKDTQISPATAILAPVAGSNVSRSLLVSGTGEPLARVSLRISGSSGVISRTVPVSAGGSWTTTVGISTLPLGAISIGGTTTDSAGNTAPISVVNVIKA